MPLWEACSLQSEGTQIRDSTGLLLFDCKHCSLKCSVLHTHSSKLHASLGSLLAAIRRTSDQGTHRIVPLCVQASIFAMICPSFHFKTSCHTGRLNRSNPKDLRSETAQDPPPFLASTTSCYDLAFSLLQNFMPLESLLAARLQIRERTG